MPPLNWLLLVLAVEVIVVVKPVNDYLNLQKSFISFFASCSLHSTHCFCVSFLLSKVHFESSKLSESEWRYHSISLLIESTAKGGVLTQQSFCLITGYYFIILWKCLTLALLFLEFWIGIGGGHKHSIECDFRGKKIEILKIKIKSNIVS